MNLFIALLPPIILGVLSLMMLIATVLVWTENEEQWLAAVMPFVFLMTLGLFVFALLNFLHVL